MTVRIFGSISEQQMEQVDASASEQNISRSKWLQQAIEAYLQDGNAHDSVASSAEVMQLRSEIEQYKSMMKQSEQQILFLQGHVSQLAGKDASSTRASRRS